MDETPTEATNENTPAAEPAPDDTAQNNDTGGAAPAGEAGSPAAELADFVARAAKARQPQADEDRAAALVGTLLLGGKKELADTAALLPALPWVVAVKGVTTAWPELKPTPRTALLKALAADESDASLRTRLSVARGLFGVDDAPSALKLATGVCKVLRAEDGSIKPKAAQAFANVLIGKGKPWIAQLPLAELKPAEADAIVHAALTVVFTIPHAPVSQLGVLRWAAEAGRIAELDEPLTALAAKSLARLSGRWQAAVRAEVPGLSETLAAVMTKQPSADPDPTQAAEEKPAGAGDAEPSEESGEEGERPKRKEYPVYVSKTMSPREPREPEPESDEPQENAPPRPERQQQQRGGKGRGDFNLGDTLRQIDGYVAHLRRELSDAQGKLRSADRQPRREKKEAAPVIEGAPTPDELARLNIQLEARNTELQARIDDLAADAEARAVSSGAIIDAPPPDADTQLRTLLALKLQEAYEDFLALETEDPDVVVQQHYRTLLREIFDVLVKERVPFQPPQEA